MENAISKVPLVSILIPTYNQPGFFEEALRSALGQTYENIEVIVCDNSTDDQTEKVIQTYLSDQRLRYVRNAGAKTKEENFVPFEHLASGEYIQWLMHDDILVRDKIAQMVEILEKRPDVTLVTSQRAIIDQDGNQIVSELQADLPIEGKYRIFSGQIFGNAILRSLTNYLGEPSAVLFRRKDLMNHYWHAECRGYLRISDVVMWLELLEKGNILIFKEPLSFYRRYREQEGQQIDVILESRLEWYQLEQEYYTRQVFLHKREEYAAGLRLILEEYPEWKRTARPKASKAMWQRYEHCISTIEQELHEMRNTSTVRITACLIAKDEACRLSQWMQCIQKCSDEIILIDTGSTDQTIEIAQQAGAEVYPQPWTHDFSAARNAALARAQGEWIIFLDADETFYHPEQVREIIEQVSADTDGIQVPIINVDEDAGSQEIQQFPALRIWRNRSTRRYAGRIHEALYEDGRPLGRVIFDDRLAVRHTGYSSLRIRGKLERNLHLLEKEMRIEGEQPRFYRYLADCCYGLGEYELALAYATKAIEKEPATVDGQQSLYVLSLDSMEKLSRTPHERLVFAEQTLEIHPDYLDIQAYCGILAAQCGKDAEARCHLEAFLSGYQQGNNKRQATAAYALLPRVYRIMGRLLLQDRDIQQAEGYLRKSLEGNRYDEWTLNEWTLLCEGKQVGFIESLPEFYVDTKRDKSFLRGWVIHQGQLRYRSTLASDLLLPTCQESVKMASQEVQCLFQALYVRRGNQRQLSNHDGSQMLPEAMQRILEYADARCQKLQAADADAYQAGLDSMLWSRDRQRLNDYVMMSLAFDWPVILGIADKLMAREEWQLAFSLFQQVPEDEIEDPGKFWHQVGVCLYYLDETAALECFDKAEAAGCQAPDIAAYRSWMKEACIHD